MFRNVIDYTVFDDFSDNVKQSYIGNYMDLLVYWNLISISQQR